MKKFLIAVAVLLVAGVVLSVSLNTSEEASAPILYMHDPGGGGA